jgi:imidazoleglycerol phosphate dehydratase HisB
MTAILDLSLRPQDRDASRAAALIDRLAAMLDVQAERLVLASCPDAARQAVWARDMALVDDRSAEGVLGLDGAAPAGLTLIRFGPCTAPLCVLCAIDARQAAELQGALTQPPACLLEAGGVGLSPGARLAARSDREERDRVLDRVAEALGAQLGEVPRVTAQGLSFDQIGAGAAKGLGLKLAEDGEALVARIPDAETARTLEAFLGLKPSVRRATVRRTTKETDIALSVDLDGEGASISTGVHFFDHMLEQIARHGGIGLQVSCEGDVEVDAHHTIEDVCLALGDGLRQALGDKRGIARFGFEVPMDETRAGVWIDLSGRPYALFEGDIPGERVGDFPVEMCEHAFRSLAETLKAAIHVKVEGENAHHMIESCFKAFGRALRMAARIEGDALPSTKGVL